MVILAQESLVCECGGRRFAPEGESRPGELVICHACGQPSRVALALVPVEWSEVETELGEASPWDLCAFRWVAAGASVARGPLRLGYLSKLRGRLQSMRRARL
jgi:hypothetical protein